MKFYWVAFLALLITLNAQAQRSIELGIRGGGTFTHGFTIIPAQTISPGLEVPRIRNTNNGIGVGYLGSVWIRKKFDRFFLQAEVNYSSLVLKQKAPIDRIDVAAATEFGVNLPISLPPGTLFASLNTTSEPTLNSITIPIYIGKQWQEGKWRVYGGPTLLVTQKAEAERTASGKVGANSSINFPGYTITNITDHVDLTDPEQAGILQVKNINFGVEFGAGMTLLKRLEVDVRYGLPVGGVFNDRGITGFIGYATLAVGYKLADF
ncbi:outer membrane beta-barrel protein [Larkinella terrae]|uniref:Outer membrane beta-barrel protein n=1 Tax=Larkinella terrae TaxID=2025311 RepID=A0A7K0ESG4_9BACT|nr:outer membrane beta-barrel protein [Larkinella terrae]MRS64476.1 outer membrane beta-barrel protein [Larkinella terrae]